jgi:hypothetical protein
MATKRPNRRGRGGKPVYRDDAEGKGAVDRRRTKPMTPKSGRTRRRGAYSTK